MMKMKKNAMFSCAFNNINREKEMMRLLPFGMGIKSNVMLAIGINVRKNKCAYKQLDRHSS